MAASSLTSSPQTAGGVLLAWRTSACQLLECQEPCSFSLCVCVSLSLSCKISLCLPIYLAFFLSLFLKQRLVPKPLFSFCPGFIKKQSSQNSKGLPPKKGSKVREKHGFKKQGLEGQGHNKSKTISFSRLIP